MVAHRVVGVLEQLVDEAAAVVIGDLRLLRDVLTEPDWARSMGEVAEAPSRVRL